MRTPDQRRAAWELGRRLRQRRRKAEGLSLDNGGVGKYHIPSPATSAAGVEAKRLQKVTVTLPKLNLPELGDEP